MGTLKLYCERLDAGLWAEPLNATSNIAFFLAAWLAWRAGAVRRQRGPAVQWLVGLMVAIGIGSTLFHTFATTWARMLDLFPIFLFQVSFLWLYGRRVVRWGVGATGALLVGFVVAIYISRAFPNVLNRSLLYAPGFLCNVGLGVYHWYSGKQEPFRLLAAAGVLTVALVFRTIDTAICPYVPWGTHFLWHLLIPFVLYLAFRALLANLADPQDASATTTAPRRR